MKFTKKDIAEFTVFFIGFSAFIYFGLLIASVVD